MNEFDFDSRPQIQADPISIAIALRAAQRSTIQEGQLTYGFQKKPIDQLPRPKIRPNIPEEKLFAINSKVIEFQQPNESVEDEFKIDDSDEVYTIGTKTEYQPQHFDKSCLSYSDIGFSESMSQYPKFKNVPISTTPNPYIAPTIDPIYNGRIITLPEEKRCANELDQFLTEYLAKHYERRDIISR